VKDICQEYTDRQTYTPVCSTWTTKVTSNTNNGTHCIHVYDYNNSQINANGYLWLKF